MEIASLVIEFLLFGLGLYLYLYSRGAIKAKNPETQKKMEEFRVSNGTWMRYLGLALVAIMLINIILHFREMAAG